MRNIPNYMTLFRFFAALGIVLSYILFPRPVSDLIALILFATGALLDFLDGYVARMFGLVSEFGRMMDPIADKVLVIVAFVAILVFFESRELILIPVCLIVFRELLVSGLREYLSSRRLELRVTAIAKWKTAVQLIAVLGILLGGVLMNLDFQPADQLGEGGMRTLADYFAMGGIALTWLAGLLTLISGLDYLMKSLNLLKANEVND